MSELEQALADLDGNVARLEAIVDTITEAGRGAPPEIQWPAAVEAAIQRIYIVEGGQAHAAP